jgi:hypothetical protein
MVSINLIFLFKTQSPGLSSRAFFMGEFYIFGIKHYEVARKTEVSRYIKKTNRE